MIAPISSPRDAVGVCLLGDKLYAVGGYDGQQYIKDVESYDPIANEWTKVFPKFKFEPPHEISNNVVCLTSKPQISLGMCDQQSLRSACAYTQSDQSLC